MTSEPLRRVEELYHQARAWEAHERQDRLRDACGNDPTLYRDVQSLLAADDLPISLLDHPAELAVPPARPVAASGRQPLGEQDTLAPVAPTQRKVGPYVVLRQLGVGGMGEVYLAEDTRLGRKVALKFLTPEFAEHSDRVRRFMQEAKAASALNHPNIVTVYDVGDGDQPFIATELVEGQTLRQCLHAGAMALSQILEVAAQLTGAVAAAHRAGIVHRDIKPENVMIRTDGYVKLLDFGIAKLMDPPSGVASAEDASTRMSTRRGVVVGTPSYMSPEQVRGLPVDPRTDVFSLGVLFYEMVTGHAAFSGETASDRLAAVLNAEPPPMSAHVAGVPAPLDALIRKAMSKARDDRHPSADALLEDVKAISLDPPPGAAKTSRSTLWMLAGAIILIAAAIAAVPRFITQPADERRAAIAPVSAPSTMPSPMPVAFSYWITVQKYRDGKPYEAPFRLAREINFERDYRIRLNISGPRSGFLYLVSEAPDGNSSGSPYNLLAATPVDGGQVIQVPEQSWFQFDNETGTEKVWMVWASQRVPDLEAGVKFVNAKDKGAISEARVSDAIRDFLRLRASHAEVGKEDGPADTRVLSDADPVVHLLRLEHN